MVIKPIAQGERLSGQIPDQRITRWYLYQLPRELRAPEALRNPEAIEEWIEARLEELDLYFFDASEPGGMFQRLAYRVSYSRALIYAITAWDV